MAFTIMGGLWVVTFLTRFLRPSIYALWNRRSLGRDNAGASARARGAVAIARNAIDYATLRADADDVVNAVSAGGGKTPKTRFGQVVPQNVPR